MASFFILSDDYLLSSQWGEIEQSYNSGTMFSPLRPNQYKVYLSTSDGHKLVHCHGNKRVCGYCNLVQNKYRCGQTFKSFFKCEQCNVHLCRSREKKCFVKFHELMQDNPGLDPATVVNTMKSVLKKPPLFIQ